MSEKEIFKENKSIKSNQSQSNVTPPPEVEEKPSQQKTEESLDVDDSKQQKDNPVRKGNKDVLNKDVTVNRKTKKKEEFAKNKEATSKKDKNSPEDNSKHKAEIIDKTKKDLPTKNKETTLKQAPDDDSERQGEQISTKGISKGDAAIKKDKDKKPAEKKVSKSVDASNKKKKGVVSKKKVRAVQDQELPQKKQTSLTDHFQVRRSERQLKLFAEDEKLFVLQKQILSGVEDGLEIRVLEEKGRGIFAATNFQKGNLVCEYAGELINFDEAKTRESEYEKTPEVGSYMYFFEYKNNKYCVDATKESGRLGRLLNHSKTSSNVHTKLFPIKDIPHLILVASRDIKVGEELLYDYGDHSKKSLDSHPWLKN